MEPRGEESTAIVTKAGELLDRDKILEIAFAFFSKHEIVTSHLYLTQIKIVLRHELIKNKFTDIDKVKMLKFIDDLDDCILHLAFLEV